MPQPPKTRNLGLPLRVDPAIEKRVQDRLRSFELANALAQSFAQSEGQPNAPRDNLGYISPYRAQAMARIDENESRQFRNHTNYVPGESSMMGSPAEKARVDTDRARVNAYALLDALLAQQKARIQEEQAKQRGTPRWR